MKMKIREKLNKVIIFIKRKEMNIRETLFFICFVE